MSLGNNEKKMLRCMRSKQENIWTPSIGGDHAEIKKIVQYSDEINNLEDGKESPYDHSTMLFLTTIDWKEGGDGHGVTKLLAVLNL